MARRTLSGCLLALALLLGSSARAGNDGTLGLAWDPPPPGEQVDGYFLYWGTAPGGPYPSASPPIYVGPSGLYAYTLTGLADCTMFYFVVTAFAFVPGDDGGAYLESGYSNEISSWPLPTVTKIAPATSAQDSHVSLAIEGTNFDTLPSNPVVTFSEPALVAGLTSVTDCYHLSVPVDVNCAPMGDTQVIVSAIVDGPAGKSTAGMFTVTASATCAPPDAGMPADASAPDAAAPGLDASAPPGPDASVAPGKDASSPGLDASPAPGPDAAAPGLDAAAIPGEDASGEPPDARAPRKDAAQDDAATEPGLDATATAPADAEAIALNDAATSKPDAALAHLDADTRAFESTIEAGCGCSSSGFAAPALLALFGLGALRRSRRRPVA